MRSGQNRRDAANRALRDERKHEQGNEEATQQHDVASVPHGEERVDAPAGRATCAFGPAEATLRCQHARNHPPLQ
ncbi:MAG: hypothetical protein ABI843_12945 [Dokdonella sp.]